MTTIEHPFPKQFDTLIINANLATFSTLYGFDNRLTHPQGLDNSDAHTLQNHNPYGQLTDAAIAIKDGKITWIGDSDTAVNHVNEQDKNSHEFSVNDVNINDETIFNDKIYDAKGQWITSGLIDCHTHLVYAGNRSNEFEARLQGVSYQQISDNGGGIIATVSATRTASFEELYTQSAKRLESLLSEGVSCIEIKSGYGLDLDTERKMLQVARKLGEDYPVTVKTTYLAAHALPTEYKDKPNGADHYIAAVCEWLPILHAEGLVDAVDGFCENIGFSMAQIAQVFEVAKSLGLPVKLHAEQLSDMNGSGLVADYHGLSSDHLEYLSEDNVIKMAKSDTVAVLLPGAFYTLKETQLPPLQALHEHNVAIALSTDCNPGTSPLTSLLLILNMGCTLFAMTPEEALAGITLHAAKALGVDKHKGRIEVGLDADLVAWDIARPADLAYMIGFNPLSRVMVGGEWLE